MAKEEKLIIVLFDTPQNRQRLYPISLTRPIGKIRAGMMTIAEWWAAITELEVFCLSDKWRCDELPKHNNYLCIDATILPTMELAAQLVNMEPGSFAEDINGLVSYCLEKMPGYQQIPLWAGKTIQLEEQRRITHIKDLIQINVEIIGQQFSLVSKKSMSREASPSNTLIGNRLFMAEGATMKACVINTEEGPVFIGKNALVMEGTTIRGPVSVGEGAVIKMGSRLYAGSSIGPFCTVGGEVKNVILQGYSNKAHDGYLGDSFIGAWCNLGAGTSNSNVKNNAAEVDIWDLASKSWITAGKKCGTIMGDYSRTAINTSLNTGTTIGISCSIHEVAMPPRHVPSFTWGSGERYQLDKAIRDIGNWMQFKSHSLSPKETGLLTDVYNHNSD